MLLTNSHDGTIAIDLRLTTVRVVCQNTLSLAMRKGRSSHIFKRGHHISPETLKTEAEKYYAFCVKASADLESKFRALHSASFRGDQLTGLIASLLPLPHPPVRLESNPKVRKQYETRVEKITGMRNGITSVFAEGCNNGFTIPPAEKTLWGALNAVTAFVDHVQEIDGDRYAHILFGSGATLKQKAYELALAQLPKN